MTMMEGTKVTTTRERTAWCGAPGCTWHASSKRPNRSGAGEDPVFAAAHLHHAEEGHTVTVEKVTRVRYEREQAR